MLSDISRARSAHERGENVSKDMPPMLDPAHSQYGTQPSGLNVPRESRKHLRGSYPKGTAAELRERNAERFSIASDANSPVDTPPTPDAEQMVPTVKPLGVISALLRKGFHQWPPR